MRLLSSPLVLTAAILSLGAPAAAQGTAASPSVAAASSDPAAVAQQHYRRGIELYQRRQFAEALDAFRSGQSQYPSPNIRLYIARSLRGLGRLDEAATEYDLAAREAADRAIQDPRYAPTQAAATEEQRALAPQIGRVRILAPGLPAWAWIRVGGHEIPAGSLGLAIPVMPGQVTLEIAAHGYRPVQLGVTVSAGAIQQVSVTVERAPEWDGQPPTAAELAAEAARRAGPSRAPVVVVAPHPREPSHGSLRPLAWGVLGIGVVGLVGVASFGGASLGIYNGVVERCGGAQCPVSEQANIDLGRTFQTVANVSLVVGIVGALGGATLLWLSRDTGPRRTSVGFSGNGLVVGGVF